MNRRTRTRVDVLPGNFITAAALLVVLPIIGTAGYMILEGWSFIDALYMTVITLTTVGFTEVRDLDTGGRIFTMLLIVSGVGAILYAFLVVFQFVLEGELGLVLGRQRMKGRIEGLKDHYILCGFGRVGEEVARELASRNVPFVVVENNPEAIERAEKRGYLLLVGDATTDAVLKEAGVDRARCLLAASDSDSGNTFIVLTAKALNPGLFMVARAAQPESESRIQRAGANRVFSPYLIAGRQMAISALQPMVVEFIDTLATGQKGDRVLAEIEVSDGSGLAGQTIHDILHACRTVVVLGLQRSAGELEVGPPGSTVMSAGDRVILMGAEEELNQIRPGRAQAAR